MAYRIEFSTRATRKFMSLPREIQERLKPLIASLSVNPRPAAAIRLKEIPGCYRLRRGKHCVIYAVGDDRLIVVVLSVVDRKDAYTRAEIAAISSSLRDWQRDQQAE